MSQPSGAIIRTVQFGLFNAPPKAHPSDVYIVSNNDGRIRRFTGIPSLADREGSRFCYVVDTAERRVRDSFTVPTSVDAYSFPVEVEATWKVTDPMAVFRAGLRDGNEAVLAWLKDEMWVIGRAFQPKDDTGAEAAARSALSRRKNFDEGLTVLRATARFRVDPRLAAAVVERDQDAHQSQREEQRMLNLRRLMAGGEEAMILLHLMQHPDDTGSVLQMMTDARDKNQSAWFALLDRMLERKLITDADAQPLRDSVLGQAIIPPTRMRPITAHVTPPALPPVTASQAIPPAASPTPGPAGTQTPGPVPIDPVPIEESYVHRDTTAPTRRARIRPLKRPQSTQPAGPTPQPAPSPTPAVGRVKGWKSLKKNSDQGPE